MSLTDFLSAAARSVLGKPLRLRLYQMQYCPYCVIVRETAENLGIDIDFVDVTRDLGARDYLIERLGRGTVPVLAIPTDDGEDLLPESRDIIRYLERISRGQSGTRPRVE